MKLVGGGLEDQAQDDGMAGGGNFRGSLAAGGKFCGEFWPRKICVNIDMNFKTGRTVLILHLHERSRKCGVASVASSVDSGVRLARGCFER